MSEDNAKSADSASLGTVVICTALGLEYTAVQDYFDDAPAERDARDVNGTLYEIGSFSILYGQWTVALTQTGPDNTSAGIELERAIHTFSRVCQTFGSVAGCVINDGAPAPVRTVTQQAGFACAARGNWLSHMSDA
jgi:hypothetical protein